MGKRILYIILTVVFFAVLQGKVFASSGKHGLLSPLAASTNPVDNRILLASHVMPLDDRYPVQSVSDVFRDNILLTLNYLSGKVSNASQVHWDEIRKPFKYEFELKPGEVFAFHDDVLPAYQGKVVITTKAHFNAGEGFVSDGYLYGDGVCHLASVMNWVARDAGLKVEAPVNHDFANIPDIAKEYGTAIYSSPGQSGVNQQQNLYIENTSDKTVKFVFDYADEKLKLSIYSVAN